jgi:hypothetical protein
MHELDEKLHHAEAKLADIAEEIDAGNICVSAEHKIDHIRHILIEQEEKGK